MNNFETIRKDGRLLYEYIRGSHLYGLNNEDSDIDTGGVFICTKNELLGLHHVEQVSDSKHDNTWYEIGNLISLLLKSNPTVLECLFAPQDKVIGEIHPIMQELIANRNEFITKQCFNPLFGYARSQIEKARGLNKKISNPIVERKTPLDFTYTFKDQGSQPILQWLEGRGLKPEYCGLNKIPHMNDMYGVYYDWGGHYKECNKENPWEWNSKFVSEFIAYTGFEYRISKQLELMPVLHYRGLTTEEVSHTTQLRLSSIDDKNDIPICHISFNQSGFQEHCRKYKEFKEWEKNRNPVRYESNLDKTYDSKNMMHCFRLIHMAQEIAAGEGFNLIRTWDREFLLNVRNHKYEYDEIIEMLESEKSKMNTLMESSTIKEKIDFEFTNNLLINIRNKQLYDSGFN